MTLAELRKKYVGKRVADSYANQHTISIDLDADPEYQYFAKVTIDDDRKITHISKRISPYFIATYLARVHSNG